MPRHPLPPGLARTEKLYTKVRPAAADEFRRVCEALRITPADGLRQAASDFVAKHRSKVK